MNEIHAYARSSDQVDKRQRYTSNKSKGSRLLRFRLVLGEGAKTFRNKHRMENQLENFRQSNCTENYLELMENR